jgi:L-threonylcarbamoyladenylate synthase
MKIVEEAAETIKKGGIVVYPTETVYGLGADVFSEEAIKSVYEIKNRSFSEPLSIAVSSHEMMEELVYIDHEDFIKRFLPGPMTVILKKKAVLPDILNAGSDLVGIRYPDHLVALQIINLTGPITSTSANPSGRESPTCVEEVEVEVDLVVDGGKCKYSMESTIVDLVNMRIVRKGAGYDDYTRAFAKSFAK